MEDQKRDPGRRATEATVKFVAVLSVHVSTACCKRCSPNRHGKTE
jgi:hypothetical protein